MSGVFRVGEEAYDDFMGRYSVRLAPLFADFAGVREGDRALDVGAGTGALAAELQRRGARVTAAEPSPSSPRRYVSGSTTSTRRRPKSCRSRTVPSTSRSRSSSSHSWPMRRAASRRWRGSPHRRRLHVGHAGA